MTVSQARIHTDTEGDVAAIGERDKAVRTILDAADSRNDAESNTTDRSMTTRISPGRTGDHRRR